MRVEELGEFGLIARIEALARRVTGRDVVLGIGDDAALVRPRSGEDLVVSTDAHVEGVHFRWREQSARRIGERALVANLSDLAAMGARPLGLTLSLAVPPRAEVRAILEVVRGLLAAAAPFGCPLVGGNVARASETALHVTALGAVRRGRALRRAAARAGDRLLVTGVLGAEALARRRAAASGAPLRRRSEPRIAAGLALARLRGVGACIDVSDGLASDLAHLCAASGVGAEVDFDVLPRPRGFEAACRRLRARPEALLFAGGEDYELLFTVRPGAPGAEVLATRLGTPVAEIGRIVAGAGTVRWSGLPRGVRGPGRSSGWRHF